MGLLIPTVSEETKLKLSKKSSEANVRRYKDPALRKRLSESMKKAEQKYPESYGTSNRGRSKRIGKYGILFQGKWELVFFEWCLEAGLFVSRPSEGFPYAWKGGKNSSFQTSLSLILIRVLKLRDMKQKEIEQNGQIFHML